MSDGTIAPAGRQWGAIATFDSGGILIESLVSQGLSNDRVKYRLARLILILTLLDRIAVWATLMTKFANYLLQLRSLLRQYLSFTEI